MLRSFPRCISVWLTLLLCFTLFSCVNADEPKADADALLQAPLFGRIVDSTGKPVTDAKLTLQGPKYYRAETDDDGRYVFADASEPGEYRVRIESKQAVGFSNYRQLPRILIDPDKPTKKNFSLERACQVKIVVVDEAGKPIRATIYCKSSAEDDFSSSRNHSTNREGIATIGGLKKSNAKYVVGVQTKTHAYAHVVVSATDTDKVDEHKVVLKPGKTIVGKAVCSDGLPPAGWKISALPTWWNFGVYPAGSVVGDDGSFELKHVGDDEYNVSISIPLGGGMSTSRNVLTRAKLSEMKQPIAAKMDYPSPKSMSYLNVQVRWIGKPLDGNVEISGYSTATKHHISHYLKKGETKAKVGPIPPGTYRIRPRSSQIEVMNLRKIKNLDDLEHVKIPNDKPLQIVLRVRGKPHVQGVVMDAETNQPIKSFQYCVTKYRTLSGPNYVQVDSWKIGKSEKGEFETDVVGPGIYVVSVLADGYALSSSQQVNTDESPDEVLSLKLKPGITVRGKVVDMDGNPIDSAKVRVRSLAAGAMPRVSARFVTENGATDTKDGQFSFLNIGPGADSLRVDHPDFVFRETPIQVTQQMEPVTITMTRGATIQGTVFDANGKPLANETLFFHDNYAYGGNDREAGALGMTTTDDDGNYVVEHIPEMAVYISRKDEWRGNGMVRHAVFTKDGQTHTVDFGGTSRMRGRYVVNGAPLAGARLQLGGTDSTFGAMKMYANTNDDGEFSFFGAPPGHWTLYRQFDKRGSEWTRVREVDVPADGKLGLGVIEHKIGFLKLEVTTNADALPEHMMLKFQAYSENRFGRDAADVLPRETPADPFVIQNVAPGDYHLVCPGFGDYAIYQRIKVTDEIINTAIPFSVPKGNGVVKASVLDADGKPASHSLVMSSEDSRMIFRMNSQTDKAGNITSVANNVPDGKYVIQSGNRGRAPIVARVEVVDGNEQTISITLAEDDTDNRGSIRIITTNEQGVVIPCVFDVSDNLPKTVFQTASHTESLLEGPIGKHDIEIKLPGFHPIEQTVEFKPFDEQARKTVILKPM